MCLVAARVLLRLWGWRRGLRLARVSLCSPLFPLPQYSCLTRAARPPGAGDTADVGNQLVTCQQYSDPLAAQLEEAKSHLATCEADLQACQQTDSTLAAGN